jgi:hypothetical protein
MRFLTPANSTVWTSENPWQRIQSINASAIDGQSQPIGADLWVVQAGEFILNLASRDVDRPPCFIVGKPF